MLGSLSAKEYSVYEQMKGARQFETQNNQALLK